MSLLGWATLALALATTVSVCFTAKMARKTSDLAEGNEKLIEQNERHHIIDLRPIIIIESKFNLELIENRIGLLKPIHPSSWLLWVRSRTQVLYYCCPQSGST